MTTMASGTGTCRSLLPKCWQVQGSLLPECQPPPWAWLAAVWAMGGRKCLAHSIFVLISGKDYESSLKINSPPLDGDGELGLARPGSPGPFYSQGKDQPYQTESTKSSGSFYLGKPWESVYQKKKKKKNHVGKTSAKLFGTPLERGIPMKRVPIHWVLVLGHRSYTMHCSQYNALHILSFKSVTTLIWDGLFYVLVFAIYLFLIEG